MLVAKSCGKQHGVIANTLKVGRIRMGGTSPKWFQRKLRLYNKYYTISHLHIMHMVWIRWTTIQRIALFQIFPLHIPTFLKKNQLFPFSYRMLEMFTSFENITSDISWWYRWNFSAQINQPNSASFSQICYAEVVNYANANLSISTLEDTTLWGRSRLKVRTGKCSSQVPKV